MSEKVDAEAMLIKLKTVGSLIKHSSPSASKQLQLLGVILMDLGSGFRLACLAFYIKSRHVFSLNKYGYGH